MRTTSLRLARAGAPLAAAALVLAMSAPAGADRPEEPPANGRSDAPAAATQGTETTHTGDGDTPDDANDHPSGRDRSVEPGGSGAQGAATSEPDNDDRGPERDTPPGADRPGDTGGVDSDRDGNNGCGNDDDFDDDNEGRCLGRQQAPGQGEVPPATPPGQDQEARDVEDQGPATGSPEAIPPAEVGGVGVEAAGSGTGGAWPTVTEVLGRTVTNEVGPSAAAGDVEVLGATVTRPLGAPAGAAAPAPQVAGTASGQLPRTGATLLGLALFGAALAGVGAAFRRMGGSGADA